MSRPNDGGPAFPSSRFEKVDRVVGAPTMEEVTYAGMTLRQHYAALSMQGQFAALSGPAPAEALNHLAKIHQRHISDQISVNAFEAADAMIRHEAEGPPDNRSERIGELEGIIQQATVALNTAHGSGDWLPAMSEAMEILKKGMK